MQPMRPYAVYVPLCVKAKISNLFYTLDFHLGQYTDLC